MALVGKLTPDYKLKLKGSLTTGYDGISFDKDGNLFAFDVCTLEPGFDDTELIDDIYLLDDTYTFDGVLGIDSLLQYIFNLTATNLNINYFMIDNNRILLNEILENQVL